MSDGGDPAGRRPESLWVRVASGLVIAAVALLATYLGGWAFRLLSVAVAAAVFHEWTTMAARAAGAARHVVLLRSLLAIVLAVLLAGAPAAAVFGVLVAALIVGGVLAVRSRVCGMWTTAGLAYAAAPATALSFVRDGDRQGLAAVLFIFAVVWATDICAYFIGRAVRGPRLAPRISPGKTWSGALGGALAGALAGLAVAFLAGTSIGLAPITLVALGLSVAAQAGDLFESAVKRRVGVKDSGQLIPGHGGVMDRVDGLVIAAFVFYLIGALSSGADVPSHGFFLP